MPTGLAARRARCFPRGPLLADLKAACSMPLQRYSESHSFRLRDCLFSASGAPACFPTVKAILIFRQLDRRNISIQYVTVVYVSPQYFSWAKPACAIGVAISAVGIGRAC